MSDSYITHTFRQVSRKAPLVETRVRQRVLEALLPKRTLTKRQKRGHKAKGKRLSVLSKSQWNHRGRVCYSLWFLSKLSDYTPE